MKAAGEKTLRLRNLATRLGKLTTAMGEGHRNIECRGDTHLPDWEFTENNHQARTKRDALVLVVSDYSASGADMSLLGAARDLILIMSRKKNLQVSLFSPVNRITLFVTTKCACSPTIKSEFAERGTPVVQQNIY